MDPDRLVEAVVGGGEVQAGPARVAVGGDGDRGQHDRAHAAGGPVAHGVEQGQVCGVAVDRVVEGVTPDVVAGLEDAGDHRTAGGERQRRELGAQHLRGQAHRFAAAEPFDGVAVEVAGHHDLPDDRSDGGAVGQGLVGQRLVRGDLKDAHALAAVEQRHPDHLFGVLLTAYG
ncbi:hypothetical protein [Actinoplanes sp. URMC 104]|uniref:hypothetical protein n=1 Tax=Actinoplanes sp. URMC 104 TaxID=3423409 RepID=UPI003F1E2743